MRTNRCPVNQFDTWVMRAQSWDTVRGWLCDLAEEMHAGLRDGSLPALELDRVWIGNDGRARLLDWPAPNDHPDLADSPLPRQAVDLPQAERFLYRVAVSALEGHVLADTHVHVVRRECRFQCRRLIVSRSLVNNASQRPRKCWPR